MLAKKLHALKCELKKWNKEVLGNVSARKDATLEQLNHWDIIERLRPLSEEDRRSQWTTGDEYSHFAKKNPRRNFLEVEIKGFMAEGMRQ